MSDTIDLHCHLLPGPEAAFEHLPIEFGTGANSDEVIYRGASVGPIRRALTDPAEAVRAMDRAGLARRAMSVAPLSYRYDLAADEAARWHAVLNDSLAEACAGYPDRLLAIGIVPLQDAVAAAAEARRAVTGLGMCALEIGTHVAGRTLDDPALDPFWTAVEELDVPLFVHPEHTPDRLWSEYYLINLMGNPVETAVAVAHLIFGGVLDRHPRLRFWLAHGGGVAPWLAGRFRHGWRVRAEPRRNGAGDPMHTLASHFWFDTLTHDPGTLAALAGRWGADRLVLGSDSPFDMGDPDPLGSLHEALQDPAEREAVLRASRTLLGPAAGPVRGVEGSFT